ncbi:MAG TPA: aminotransferase class I/II-fold pyridoxal phosphate-dependent enzyme [Candidatus Bathyarchaeia archaeon]|nr:aminotransferase class I/II-fold pyridoxal phosphate-dependent enzyme [Candidatus Bathyarchaeia archaeon]
MIAYADRVEKLPPYIFADLERLQKDLERRRVDIISLGIGDPDLPPPRIITESLMDALNDSDSNNYPSSAGEEYFRKAVAEWYQKRFDVTLDPEREVCALIGSKEGLATVGRLILNPGDKALVPDPAYPVYAQGATILSDAVPAVFPLRPEDDFQPDFSNITVPDRTKLLFLNYPNNPTGAVATEKTLKATVDFCNDYGLVLCYDNAYSEVSFDSYRPPSPLQIDGAGSCTIEFNSCSKMFNMTGYRIGFAVGHEKIITGMKKLKTQVDSGTPKFVQKAASIALRRYFDNDLSRELRGNRRVVKERLDILAKGLRKIGLTATIPRATFYLWVNVEMDGVQFVKQLLKTGVVATPGSAFGNNGTNYVRFSVTQPTDKISEAVERIEKIELDRPVSQAAMSGVLRHRGRVRYC